MLKRIFQIREVKIVVVIFVCLVAYIRTPYFSWNVKSARVEAEQYIEQQYKFKPKYVSGVYSSNLDGSNYFMYFVDEKNGIRFTVILEGGRRFFLKQIKQYVEKDTYLEEFLIKNMREEISPIVKKEWGKGTKVSVNTVLNADVDRTWDFNQQINIKKVESYYKESYAININVKKGDKKQEEAEKAFEVIKYLKDKNYLPLHVDVNYEVDDGEIKHFSMKDIYQISSANDILALMN